MLLFAVQPLAAQVIAEEPFDYAAAAALDGSTGGTGFGEPWFESDASGNDLDIISDAGLTFDFLATSGRSLLSRAPEAYYSTLTRTLGTTVPGTAGTTVWASFLMRKDSQGSGAPAEDYFGLVLYQGTEDAPALFIGDTSETDFYSLGIAGAAAGQVASTVQSHVSAQPALLVVKVTFNNGNDTFELFVNPNPAAGAPTTASATKNDLNLANISAIGILAGLNATWTADEIRIGRDFNDVVPQPGRFANISTRMRVETDDNALIAGFIITGSSAKRVIVRAIGPSLTEAIPGALQDPTLQLVGPDGVIAENDDWRTSQEQDINATGVPPQDDRESAIVATLPEGGYTAVVRGANNTTGVGLVEVYDLENQANTRLANISTRGFVQTQENVMIGGIIVVGDTSRRVIFRGRGPSLAQAGVSNALQDPVLQLFDGNGAKLRENDSWRSDQEQEIIATTIPPDDNHEAAIVESLRPGGYTIILSGKDGTTGVGSVEAYQL